MNLLFFPFVGGAVETFHAFDRFLDKSIDTVMLEMPGRFARKDEPVAERVEDIASDFLTGNENLLKSGEYAVFCHSMGVLCAVEFIRQALEKNLPMPVHMFISGRYTPDGKFFANADDCTDKEIVDFFTEKGLMQKSATTDTALIEETNAILCHDMRMAEKYTEQWIANPDIVKLPCDITVMYGTKDLLLEKADMSEWKRFTEKSCEVIPFSGGHFYYRLNKKSVCGIINNRLEQYK